MAKKSVPVFPSLLTRGYLRQLQREGVEKLSASHLKAVASLESSYAAASAEVDSRPGSLMSRAAGGAR